MVAAGTLVTRDLRVGATAEEIVAIARAALGASWEPDGCAAFVWGVSNLAGLPFFDLHDMIVVGDPLVVQNVDYALPHSPGILSGTNNVADDGWIPVLVPTDALSLRAVLKPGDVVRLYKAGNAAEALKVGGAYAAHSFVVSAVTASDVTVIDNSSGGRISEHSWQNIVTDYAPSGSFGSVFVSRVDPDYAATGIPETLKGNGIGDWRAISSEYPFIVLSISPNIPITYNLIRNPGTNPELGYYPGYPEFHSSVFSPDGEKIITDVLGYISIINLFDGTTTNLMPSKWPDYGHSGGVSTAQNSSLISFAGPIDTTALYGTDIYLYDFASSTLTNVRTKFEYVASSTSWFSDLSEDGTKIAFWDSKLKVVVIDLISEEIRIAPFPSSLDPSIEWYVSGLAPEQLWFSPDGKRVFFSFEGFDTSIQSPSIYDIAMWDLETNQTSLLSRDGWNGVTHDGIFDLTFSPDGNQIALGGEKIVIVNASTGSVIRTFNVTDFLPALAGHKEISFSPNSNLISFVSWRKADLTTEVIIADLSRDEATVISRDGTSSSANGNSFRPVFSPDGSQILFISLADNLAAGDENKLPDVFMRDIQPSTSRDDYRDTFTDTSAPFGPDPLDRPRPGWLIPAHGGPSGDRDWFQTTLVEGASYRVAVNGSVATPLSDSFFSIRNASGTTIIGGEGRFGWDSYDDYDGLHASVEFTAPTDGTYYIVVGGGGLNAASQIGQYSLSVGDTTEPGPTRATAADLTPGLPKTGFIGFGADLIDMYRFTANTTGYAVAALTDTAPGTDVRKSILDHNGNPLGVDIVTAGQTYYVKLDAEGGLPSQTPYTLTLQIETPPATANHIFRTNGGEIEFLTTLTHAAYALDPLMEGHVVGLNEDARTLNPLRTSAAGLLDGLRDIPGLQALDHSDFPASASLAPRDYVLPERVDDFANTDAFRQTGLNQGVYVYQNAGALLFRTEDAVFLAFRGTNDNSAGHFLSGPPDVDDWFGAGGADGRDRHYALFHTLNDALETYIQASYASSSPIRHVYVTGHSLGGAMVDAFMSHHADRAPGSLWSQTSFSAVTLASPGYQFRSRPDDRIINFVNQDDVITLSAGPNATPGPVVKIYFDDALDTPLDDWELHPFQGAQHSVDLYQSIIKFLDLPAAGIGTPFLGRVGSIVVPSRTPDDEVTYLAPLLSGQYLNKFNWLSSVTGSKLSDVCKITDSIEVFSNTVTENTCINV